MKTKILLSFLLSLSFPLFAEEKKEETTSNKESKDLPEWVQIEAQLSSLEAKTKGKESNIARLIEEKEKLSPDDPRSKKIVNEMIAEHKELQTLSAEYDKQRALLKYRFPERGLKSSRKYEKIEVKSLEQMEESMTIDGRLSKNIEKMRSQYGDQDKAQKTKKQAKGKNQNSTTQSAEPSIEEQGSIVIGK